MYAVIKTGGKQYRVSPGDLLVVEKLDGEPGASVAFGEVLMMGEGEAVVVGAPLIAGASVAATLIETRKGEKVKVFKKKRRQGYRRTLGHRQTETVLRVTGITGDGKSAKWDGEVSLTTRGELNARARGLDFATLNVSKKTAKAEAKAAAPKAPAKAKAAAAPKAVDAAPAEAPAEAKAASPKATQPKGEAKAPKPASPKATQAKGESKAAAPAKKAAAPKTASPKASQSEGKAAEGTSKPVAKKSTPKKDKGA